MQNAVPLKKLQYCVSVQILKCTANGHTEVRILKCTVILKYGYLNVRHY